MGKIIKLDTEWLIPTQPELKENQFEILLGHYLRSSGKDFLIPVKPSEDKDGKFLHYNGHHSACLIDVVGKRLGSGIYGWIPGHNRDFIPEELTGRYVNDWFNQDNWTIEGRFGNLEKERKGCPNSIAEMREKYSWLNSMESMLNYFFPHLGKKV